MDATEALAAAPYPGRGLVVCRLEEGLAIAYWLSGRSPASRNRALVAVDDEISAVDLGGDTSDALRHYRCSRTTEQLLIVGNGDHVDDLAERTARGSTAFDALLHQRPEPDPPIRTARVAALVDRTSWAVVVGAARATMTAEDADHIAVAAARIPQGAGLLITTYRGDPERPATWAIPTWVDTPTTLPELLEGIWSALDERFRVSVATRALEAGGSWAIKSAHQD